MKLHWYTFMRCSWVNRNNRTINIWRFSKNVAVVVANACKPELVFLDINLLDGTAFDFLEQTEHLTFKVIYKLSIAYLSSVNILGHIPNILVFKKCMSKNRIWSAAAKIPTRL